MSEKPKAVVDASNVVWLGETPELDNLRLVIEKLEERGYDPIPVSDSSLRYQLSELGKLPSELEDGLDSISKGREELYSDSEKKSRSVCDMINQLTGVSVEVEMVAPGYVMVCGVLADPRLPSKKSSII